MNIPRMCRQSSRNSYDCSDIQFQELTQIPIPVHYQHHDRIHHPIFSTDEFRMFGFKIKRCSKTRSHDWTECPFAHRGEKARRRDPRRVNYSAISCPDFRTGDCPKGEMCEYAHGVFEYWLHPAKYRTRACNAGAYCQRKVCFFAHTPEQLRSESSRYRLHFMYRVRGSSNNGINSSGVEERARGGSVASRAADTTSGDRFTEFLRTLRGLRISHDDERSLASDQEMMLEWISELVEE